ncbi:MAG TPA: SufE family protein [Melioribacteraceae bacterium]|nr:SufE family protein [Melioribacteraceae bacterium]
MTIQEKQDNFVQIFEGMQDWENKYELIITYGRHLPPFNEEHRIDKYKIEGCQSQVWIYAEFNEGRIRFAADSDAQIVKGLIALLLAVYNDATPDEILSSPPVFLKKIGIDNHLSPTRKNGLNAMLKQIQLYALAYKKLSSVKNNN